MKKRILVVYVALYASGNQLRQICGVAVIVGIQSTSLMVVGRNGIRFRPEGCARVADINGVGQNVFAATVGRYTKIGMSRHGPSDCRLLIGEIMKSFGTTGSN